MKKRNSFISTLSNKRIVLLPLVAIPIFATITSCNGSDKFVNWKCYEDVIITNSNDNTSFKNNIEKYITSYNKPIINIDNETTLQHGVIDGKYFSLDKLDIIIFSEIAYYIINNSNSFEINFENYGCVDNTVTGISITNKNLNLDKNKTYTFNYDVIEEKCIFNLLDGQNNIIQYPSTYFKDVIIR